MKTFISLLLVAFMSCQTAALAQSSGDDITITHQIDDWSGIGLVTCESFDEFTYESSMYPGKVFDREYTVGSIRFFRVMDLTLWVKPVSGRLFYRIELPSKTYFTIKRNTDSSIPFNAYFTVNAHEWRGEHKLTYYLNVPEW